MVRNYKKKTDRKPTTPRKLQAAVALVKSGWSIRKAAKHKSVCRERLRQTVEQVKNVPDISKDQAKFKLSYQTRNVFPQTLDDELANYCIQMAQTGYGLSVEGARGLAYEVADKNRDQVKIPPNWDRDKIAGLDWFHGFQKRHPNISIRVPEACSIARAMAFNETNVKTFYDKLSEVMDRHETFKDGSRVFNLDETNTSTVQNMQKIVSPKGVRQVHQIKGAERGESVTTCMIIGAHGTILPPVHIFPRKKFNPDFLLNCYPGTLGLANSKGYMTKEAFTQVMQHFIKCTGSSLQNPTLLLLDNVDTHFSTVTLDLAKENGVVILTFPPHCTHKLQPLDVGFFGPFKKSYDKAVSNFLSANPASPPTIYRVANLVRDALMRVASPETIIKSFEAPGIVPFNRNVFTKTDFIMASTTEKPNPSNNKEQLVLESSNNNSPSDAESELQENLSQESDSFASNNNPKKFIGPLEIRGLPKVKQTGATRKPRRKGKCMVATDTPEKEAIRLREEETKQKKTAAEDRKRKREEKAEEKKKNKKLKSKQKPKKIQRVLDFESDESEEVLNDSVMTCDENVINPPTPILNVPVHKDPEEGDYVLVEFKAGKEAAVFYVGKILSEKDDDGDLQISYYRKKLPQGKTFSFTLPSIPDLNSVNISDIMYVLPKPSAAATKRQQNIISFDFDFSKFKLG